MTGRSRDTNSALLALNGDLPGAPFLSSLAALHSTIVAADGAALGLRSRNILPDVIIGDLDSLGDAADDFARAGSVVIRMESQEENDLEKGLRWLIGGGFGSVTIVGAAGGMIDHTLNNFSVLAKYAREIKIALRDPLWHMHIVAGSMAMATSPGDRISLIPLPSALVTTSGLAWALRSERLEIGVREGASNRALEEMVSIDVADGVIALIHYPNPAIRDAGPSPG
ncbi:MAG: thiamine diphosphokinase [Chlorobi bacterium]|nr:thiamine diphosphokinase [Chlorobiota bacterium]